MAYQALLFCPDERTARTVTQVLSELDFAVAPSTEPFAAVKKLMAEHFDAVVVDCDNEQNATLLFKSARNSPNNQTSLAVAVVEGQAGVAKAFRIGANLVLTKPINVEQAKGTLRVARGLLRKGETATAKPAAAARAAASAPTSVPTPPKPAPQATSPSVPAPRKAPPIAPANLAAKPPMPARPIATAFDSTAISEDATEAVNMSSEAALTASSAAKPAVPSNLPPAAHAPKLEPKPEKVVSSTAGATSVTSSSGAASAPARARESQEARSSDSETKIALLKESVVAKDTAFEVRDSAEDHATAAMPSLTFAGTVGAETSSGGKKKIVLAAAAVLVIGAVGYAAWTQLQGKATAPVQVAAKPVITPAPTPAVAPNTASSSPASSQPPVSASSVPAAPSPTPTGSVDSQASHESEDSATESEPSAVKSSKTVSTSATSAGKTKAAEKTPSQPIVIKSNSSRPASAKAALASDAPAPTIVGIAETGSNGSLPNLIGSTGNAPQPVLQRMTVSQGVSQGLVVKRVQPVYPPQAMRMRVEGSVELLATISKNGDISALKVVSGEPLLARAATDAVKQWKYKPYLLNGEPVDIQTQITVKFKAPPQ
jgi:TonB family protein